MGRRLGKCNIGSIEISNNVQHKQEGDDPAKDLTSRPIRDHAVGGYMVGVVSFSIVNF